MRPFRQRGGIEIGGFEATWPFASITVEPGLLIVGVLRRVSFTPAEVIAVERFYCIPLFYKGVVIHHRKPESECPGSVKFFTMGNLDELTRRIADAGFLLGTPPG